MFIPNGINNKPNYQCKPAFVTNKLEKCLVFRALEVLELSIRDCRPELSISKSFLLGPKGRLQSLSATCPQGGVGEG